MALRITTYADEVAEAIRDLIWAELREPLGLLRCQQDQREGFPLQELAAKLPGVIVRGGQSPTPVPDIPETQTRMEWQSWQVDYVVEIIYCEELAQTGEPNRSLVRNAGRIRDLFFNSDVLADFDPGPGFTLRHVTPGDMEPHSGTLTLDSRSLWVGEVVIPITVATVACPIEVEEVIS